MTRLLSLVIAAVLVLQTAASFDIFPKLFSRPSYVLWPFMNYPMYRTAHYEGTVIARFHVLGQTAERVEVELTPEDFGLNFRKFQDIAIPARCASSQDLNSFIFQAGPIWLYRRNLLAKLLPPPGERSSDDARRCRRCARRRRNAA